MKREQFYISTIAPDAAEAARKHGAGLDIVKGAGYHTHEGAAAESNTALPGCDLYAGGD